MKNSQVLRIFVLLCLLCMNLKISAQRTCGTDAEHEAHMHDPNYAKFIKQIKQEAKRLEIESRSIDCSNGTYTFPVAIHYNWSGVGNTVDQCMIDAAIGSIDALNEDYLGMNADLSNYDDLTATCSTYYPASAKSTGSCIEFCIAQYDHPACSSLCDGDYAITAGQFSYPNTGGCYGDYINIFVQSGTGQLGIAPLYGVTLLGGNGPQVDASTWGGPGELCTPTGLGTTFNSNSSYNLGRTLTHEMGHYFGLDHVFIGDCASDDGFADTPIQSNENFNTPVVINCDPNDAGNTANNTCGTLDMWCSFMDYSNDTHLFMFTNEQSTEMYSSAQMSPIADSAIKCSGGAAAPTADFTTGDELPVFCTTDNAPYQIMMMDNSTRCPSAWSWTFSGAGASPSSSSVEDPVITVTEAGELTATLVSTNATGASTMVTKTIYVSIAEPGSCPDCGMSFVDSGGPNSNYGDGESYTWTYCADAGQVLNVDLSSIDLAVVSSNIGENDILWIKYGSTPPTGLADSDLLGFATTLYNTSFTPQPEVFTTPGQCISFLFESNGNTNDVGWDATIACCDDVANPECAAKNVAGQAFSETISSFCNSADIFDIGALKADLDSDSKAPCGSPGTIDYNNNSYYEVTCDDTGGLLEVDVTIPTENMGNVKAYIMGPLVGDCPNYTSGNLSIQDCEEGTSGTLTISETGVTPNAKYLVFINSEDPGSFDVSSTMNSSALPVTVTTFEAENKGKEILLYWTAEMELNNDYFTLERSINGTDWEFMVSIPSKGNTTSGHKYDFLDTRAFVGQNYYRLSQTDLDGTKTIIGVVEADIKFAVAGFTIYPNPSASDNIKIKGLSPNKSYTIKLTNAVGHAIMNDMVTNNFGETTLDVDGIANGVYIVSATDGIETYVTKFVRMR